MKTTLRAFKKISDPLELLFVNVGRTTFSTHDYCSLDIGPFAQYVEMLENQYNNGTLNLESKDLVDKAEIK